ncbi:hypothetical protein F4553_007396 [Allocatelliglobosispora scoriae]|uniref:Peptidase C39-like domain-containing protein n=1 Tax=Allocatelliglobosispora scoriae TaxID=643052 RepID=A0A841C4H8_9ACTN|nr:C39 family peptidase [Allocatelliglobosispora scoriae]MBB5873962.1 hypothetical protein [Allocatelliglobosispora scoriae]
MSSTRAPLLAVLAVGATIMTGLPAAAAPAAPAPVEASAVRTASGGYDIVVNGVTLAGVGVSDPAYTVSVTPHPGGRRAAVITDFDGTSGAELRLVGLDLAAPRTLHTGRITSAAWSASGSLAHVADGVLRVQGTATAIRLPGVTPRLLGWAGERALYAETHPGAANESGYVPSAVRVDLATGAITTVLASDPARSIVYRDLRLVTVDGVQRLSYVLAQHVHPCGGAVTAIGLADLTGTQVLAVGATGDSYRSAVFSPDGRSVAAERQACVTPAEKASGPETALARVGGVNGVHIIDVSSGASRRVVAGLAVNFPLAGWSGTSVRLASTRFGDRRVDASAATPADAAALDAAVAPRASTQARINPNKFVHQLWDTRDEFNGNSACGPTSAVMDLAGYQLPNEWGIQVSSPSSHWSRWGLYITNTFSNAGTTFNRTQPDASGRGAWTGAYGWMVRDYRVGTYWNEMTDFLQRNGATVRTGLYDAAWIRARINEGYMVVTSGMYVYGQYGHIALITGYTDDGRFYVNDPYGNGTDASFDGQNSVYTLDYIRPKNYWAA